MGHLDQFIRLCRRLGGGGGGGLIESALSFSLCPNTNQLNELGHVNFNASLVIDVSTRPLPKLMPARALVISSDGNPKNSTRIYNYVYTYIFMY